MKKFIHLFDFEMERFLKFLLPTFVVVAFIQLFATLNTVHTYKNSLEEADALGRATDLFPAFSIQNVTGGGIYELSILLIVLVFMFYSFFTWYREWQGKNTFIYRLLMLPIDRSNILLSKTLVFLIGGLLAFVFQFAMYYIQIQITERIVPSSHYVLLNVHNAQPLHSLFQAFLYPTTFFEFTNIYSFAFGALLSLYAGILIERSYGLKGAVMGVIYFVAYFVVYLVLNGILRTDYLSLGLMPSQISIIILGYQFLMIAFGTLISIRLLKYKIKV